MNLDLAKKVADAVLYEGYILYPYRASAIKNRQRFNFGVLMPGKWAARQQSGEKGRLQAECLIEGEAPQSDVRVRFLQLVARDISRVLAPPASIAARQSVPGLADLPCEPVEELEVDGEIYQSWEEAIEREIVVANLNVSDLVEASQTRWSRPPEQTNEDLTDVDGRIVGRLVRRQQRIEAVVTLQAFRLGDRLWKVRVEVENTTFIGPDTARSEAQLSALNSAHVLVVARSGEFISLLEPSADYAEAVGGCFNEGVWPVLVGDEGERDLMLASPIILYDYPQVAPESDGDYFDGTEMDEMLALRVMTLTDDEKRAMRGVDRRAREILERTENLSRSSLMHLHGTIRDLKEVENR